MADNPDKLVEFQEISMRKEEFKLRYYSPDYKKEIHEQILQLLAQIKSKDGIDYEIINLRMIKNQYSQDSYADEQHEKEIYESHFKPRARLLHQRVGESIRRALRSRSGGYFVAGIIAIIKNTQVEWFTYGTEFKQYDPNSSELAFLKALLARGYPLLGYLCAPTEKAKKHESDLIDRFIESRTLNGAFEREFKIGNQVVTVEGYEKSIDFRKSVDLVYQTNETVWIIEAKTKLNYEALGQVLTYGALYEEQYNKTPQMGIVCTIINGEVLKACKRYGVTVFEVNESQVIVH